MTRHRLDSFFSGLFLIFVVGISAWRLGQADWGAWFIDYWQYAPNRYRLFNQLVLFLANGNAELVLDLTIAAWIGFMGLAYLFVQPNRNDEVLLLVWLGWTAWWGYILNAPIYLLLALIARYRNHKYITLLLIPLVLVKEFALFLAVMYLLLYRKEKRSTIGMAIVSGLVYCIIVLVAGVSSYRPGSAPLFTPIYLVETILQMTPFTFVVVIIGTVILLGYSILHTKNYLLWILNAVPIILFAIFWEPQLWLPLVVLLIAHEKGGRKRRSSTMGYDIAYDSCGEEPLTCGNIEKPDKSCKNCPYYEDCWGNED